MKITAKYAFLISASEAFWETPNISYGLNDDENDLKSNI